MFDQSIEKTITYSTDPKKLKEVKKELLNRIKELSIRVQDMSDDEYFRYSYLIQLVEMDIKEKENKYKSVL